jgi:hypothetical protein
MTVSQTVDPASAPLVPGNQPVFTFNSVVSVAGGRVNNAQLSITLSAGLARIGDIVAQPDGERCSWLLHYSCSAVEACSMLSAGLANIGTAW